MSIFTSIFVLTLFVAIHVNCGYAIYRAYYRNLNCTGKPVNIGIRSYSTNITSDCSTIFAVVNCTDTSVNRYADICTNVSSSFSTVDESIRPPFEGTWVEVRYNNGITPSFCTVASVITPSNKLVGWFESGVCARSDYFENFYSNAGFENNQAYANLQCAIGDCSTSCSFQGATPVTFGTSIACATDVKVTTGFQRYLIIRRVQGVLPSSVSPTPSPSTGAIPNLTSSPATTGTFPVTTATVEGTNITAIVVGVIVPLVIIFCLCCIGIIIVAAVGYYRKRAETMHIKIPNQPSINYPENIEVVCPIFAESSIPQSFLLQNSLISNYVLDFNLLDFSNSKILGSGGQGVVMTAKYFNTPVAVKFFSKNLFLGAKESSQKEFFNEASFLAQHSNFVNIIRFIGVAEDIAQNKVCIITELCSGGNLGDWIQQSHLSFDEKVDLLFAIACGMQYLHSHNIIHRDLKCENILLDEYHKIPKIIDFGFSKQLENISKSMHMTFNIGTAAYIAPEVLGSESGPKTILTPKETPKVVEQFNSNDSIASHSLPKSDASTNSETKNQYDKKVDVYSFGMIMYVMYTEKRNPFGNEFSSFQIMNALMKNPNTRPPLPQITPIEHNWYIDLMERCWSTDPKVRPDFDEIASILQNHVKK